MVNNDNYLLVKNPHQGDYKKALFVCSAGLLRSPTAAHWAAANKGWNTRSAGVFYGEECGWPVTEAMLAWADKIYVMQREHANAISDAFDTRFDYKIKVLNIPDQYAYRDPELERAIEEGLRGE